jgi:pimeloyl-ACP methyl ester carboxylesterase
LSGYLHQDVQEPFSRLQVPVTAIWGREGRLTPAEASAAFKRVNSQIDVHIIDKATAHIQDEQAVRFNELLSDLAAITAR